MLIAVRLRLPAAVVQVVVHLQDFPTSASGMEDGHHGPWLRIILDNRGNVSAIVHWAAVGIIHLFLLDASVAPSSTAPSSSFPGKLRDVEAGFEGGVY